MHSFKDKRGGIWVACFEDWSKKARYYPEDIRIERRNAAYYESRIALANQI